MNERKKRLAFLLATLTLASTLFTACSSDDGSSKPTNVTTNSDSVETTTAEPEETQLPSLLPEEYDLEGYELTYYGAKLQKDTNNTELGVYAEEENGDTINDAVYNRDLKVMEKYNFKINYVVCTDGSFYPANTVKSVILANDDAYDVILEGASVFPSFASEGLLVDMNSLEYMHTDQPWWPQTIIETLTLGDRLYSAVGSHMIRVKTFLFITLFNHKLAENYGIDKNDLYDAARDGLWTIDMLYSNAKDVKSDLNGDGKYDHNDLWGISGESYNAYSMTYGGGVDFVKSDDEGNMTVCVLEEGNIDVINKVLTMLTDEDTTLITERVKGVSDIWTTADNMLINDQFLFFIGNPPPFQIREMETDYGLLPSPKSSESQEFYRHTTATRNATNMMIPISCADAEKVGFIQEAICYEAYYSFLPAFYQNYIETKYARDEESIEMLQIIHDTIYYDFSGILILDEIPGVIRSVAETGKGMENVVSKLTSNIDAANTKLDKTISLILEH